MFKAVVRKFLSSHFLSAVLVLMPLLAANTLAQVTTGTEIGRAHV